MGIEMPSPDLLPSRIKTPIRCVIFDFGSVIGHFDTPRFLRFLKMYRGNDLPPESFFHGECLNVLRNYDLALLSDYDFYKEIKRIFKLDNVSPDMFFRIFGDVIWLDMEMVAIRDKLKRIGLKTALISNMNAFHAGYIRRRYPRCLDNFSYKLISAHEGVAKPDPEAWVRPMEVLGLKTDECIFIDDRLPNIEIAQELGFKAWHYNVTDDNFCLLGNLEQERGALEDYLWILERSGLLAVKR